MFINIPCIENTKKENGLYSYELKFPDIIQGNKKHIIQNSRLSENNKIDLSGSLAYNNNYYNLFSDKNRLFIFNFQSSDLYIIDQEESYYERKNISIEQLEMEKMSIHYMNQNYLIKTLCVLKKIIKLLLLYYSQLIMKQKYTINSFA